MDAKGLCGKLLLTPSADPRRAPEKQTVGTVTASHNMLTLQALSTSPNAGTAFVRRLFVTCDVFARFSWLYRGFFVASSWPSSPWKNSVSAFFVFFSFFFVAFSWPSFWANFTRTRPRKVF